MGTPVEDIKARLDIAEIIGEYVQLRPSGLSLKARCPFHNERTPSFMVSRERGSWHCFGCNKGGDVFSFVQEMEGLDFPEALRVLAKKAGVELRAVDPALQTQRTKALDVLRWVTKYYQEVLRKSAEAEPARVYLKKRGLDEVTIDLFQLGYAPEAWDVTANALQKKGFAEIDVFNAGLIMKKERGSGYYDRFRGRIMFPIRDAHGTVVGFTSRILNEQPDAQGRVPAKYVNSPQTVVYNKSAVLYGYDMAKSTIKQAGYAVLVEGNMDCIASHQSGVTNCVAISGTALTPDQVRMLKRITNRLVVAFDADAAGVAAAVRALDHAFAAAMDIAIVSLPDAKDPDELIRRDPAAWPKAIAAARPAMEHFFTIVTAGKDLNSVTVKKAVTRELLPILSKLGDPVEQSHYLEKLADLVHVAVGDLKKMLTKPSPTSPNVPISTTARQPTSSKKDHPRAVSERLLALIIADPRFLAQASQRLDPEAISGDDLRDLYRTLLVWYTAQHFVTRSELDAQAAALVGDAQATYALLSLLADREFPPDRDVPMEEDFLSLTGTLARHTLALRLRQIEADIARLERAGLSASAEMSGLLGQARELTERLRRLG